MTTKINNQAEYDAVKIGDRVEMDCPVCGKVMQFDKFFAQIPRSCGDCQGLPRAGLLDKARETNK